MSNAEIEAWEETCREYCRTHLPDRPTIERYQRTYWWHDGQRRACLLREDPEGAAIQEEWRKAYGRVLAFMKERWNADGWGPPIT